MVIKVGSGNQTKVKAVAELAAEYGIWQGAEVVAVEVQVEEFGHPRTIDETVEGAINRAKQAFFECSYSVGIEGGLIKVPHSKTGYMEVAVCAIFDGHDYSLGMSPAHEWPVEATKLILEGQDGSTAARAIGLTGEQKLGVGKGIINVLTKGRLERKDINKLAVQMALVQLENQAWYLAL